jgi:hypothetical protein
MRRCKDNGSSSPIVVRSLPIQRGHAPPVAGDKSRKAVLRHCCRQIVSGARLVVEELAGHDRADRVAAMVTIVGAAGPISKEASEGIDTARFKVRSKDVQRHQRLPAVGQRTLRQARHVARAGERSRLAPLTDEAAFPLPLTLCGSPSHCRVVALIGQDSFLSNIHRFWTCTV